MSEVRLIDANALLGKSHMIEIFDKQWVVDEIEIECAPTIDPESLRPHGRWINDYCTNCNYGVESWNNTPYCPSCGAIMNQS